MYNSNVYNPYQQYMGTMMGNNSFPPQRQEVVRVNEELSQANSLYIRKKTCDFDIGSIMGDQEEKFNKYCEKIKEIWR